VKLDDSTFSGRMAVEDFAKQPLRANLKADTFDADRYLPPRARRPRAPPRRQAEVKQQEASAMAGAGTTPLPNAPTSGLEQRQAAAGGPPARPRPAGRPGLRRLTLDKLPIQNARSRPTARAAC
jgi:AsmA protein